MVPRTHGYQRGSLNYVNRGVLPKRMVVTNGNARQRQYWPPSGCPEADRPSGPKMADFEPKSAIPVEPAQRVIN